MCLAAIWLPCSCRGGEATGDRGTQAAADSWVRRPWRWLQTLLLLKLCGGGEGRCRARPAELSPDDPGDHQNPIRIPSASRVASSGGWHGKGREAGRFQIEGSGSSKERVWPGLPRHRQVGQTLLREASHLHRLTRAHLAPQD